FCTGAGAPPPARPFADTSPRTFAASARRGRRRCLSVFVVLVLLTVRGGAQGDRAKLATAFAEIDRLFTEFAKEQHVPGAAWGIVVDGELAHSGATGFRDIATKAPVDADTVFRIASMTKSFTAMSILKLRDEGKLSLDDPAERYLPEL